MRAALIGRNDWKALELGYEREDKIVEFENSSLDESLESDVSYNLAG